MFPAPEVFSNFFGISDPTSDIYSDPVSVFDIWVVENILNSVCVLGTCYFPDLLGEIEHDHSCLLGDVNGYSLL